MLQFRGNVALAPSHVKNRMRMGHRLPQELLQELRSYLQHFDETSHLGESETIAEIKRRLRERIAEVEAQLTEDLIMRSRSTNPIPVLKVVCTEWTRRTGVS